jgi:hypothetical protein
VVAGAACTHRHRLRAIWVAAGTPLTALPRRQGSEEEEGHTNTVVTRRPWGVYAVDTRHDASFRCIV